MKTKKRQKPNKSQMAYNDKDQKYVNPSKETVWVDKIVAKGKKK